MTLEQCFMGLADRTRLRILNLLLRGELCVCDLQFVLKVPQSNVSRHLSYLKRAGLVLDRRDGYRVYYRLADHDDPHSAVLFEFLRTAFARDKKFGSELKQLHMAIRKGACTVSEKASANARRQNEKRSPIAGRSRAAVVGFASKMGVRP